MLLHARPYTTDPGTDPIAELVSKEMKTTGTQTTESSFARTSSFLHNCIAWFWQTKVGFWLVLHPGAKARKKRKSQTGLNVNKSRTCYLWRFFLQIYCQGLEKIFKKHRCEEPRANPKDFLFASEGCKATFVSGLFYFLPAGLKLCLPKQQKHLPGPFSTCDLPLLQECNDDGIDLERHLLP